jgi:hypothetical protein
LHPKYLPLFHIIPLISTTQPWDHSSIICSRNTARMPTPVCSSSLKIGLGVKPYRLTASYRCRSKQATPQHGELLTSIGVWSHKHWLSGYTHHTCGRRPDAGSNPAGAPFFCTLWYCSSGILAMLTTLVAGWLWVQILINNSCVLSPPASFMGLACHNGYIALHCKNSELYDNLRKISSNYY